MTETERLRHLADIVISNVDKKSADGEQSVVLCNYTDVYYNAHITEAIEFMTATATLNQVRRFTLRSGDILLTKDSETADDIAITALVPRDLPGVVCGYHLAIVRANQSRVNPSYLFWALRSDVVRRQFIAAATGVTRFGLRSEAIGDVTVPMCSLTEQKAIADYLDSETARIEALIAKKRRMMDLLDARRAALIEQTIRGLLEDYSAIPLKHAVRRVEVGIVITPAALYSDKGIVALRGLNVRPGELVLDDVVKISEEGHRLNQKSELHTGDVVVVRTGQTGTAAVIPESLDGCNCIDLVIIRPSNVLLPKFLEFVLNSDWTQKHVEAYSVGTIQSHFNVGAMKEVPVPLVPLEVQHAAVNNLTLATASIDELRQKLSMQVDLLHEHRRVMVTAAVTGKFEIPVPEVAA